MAKNKTAASTSKEEEAHGGSFGVGLFVGVLTGSLGMFLFGTKQGHELLQNIKRELEENPDTKQIPEQAHRLIAAVGEKVQDVTSRSQSKKDSDDFPKFKRRLAE